MVGIMNKNSLSGPSAFSGWMRINLLNAYSGLITQDIDWFFYNKYLNTFLFIEEKHSVNARIGPAQAVIFKMINDLFSFNKNFLGNYLIHFLSNGNNKEILINNKKTTNIGYLLCSNTKKILEYKDDSWFEKVVNDSLHFLWDCKGAPKNKTEPERSRYRRSYLNNYCKNPHVIQKNIHWIFVNYCSGYFILIEEKTNSNGEYKPNSKECEIISKIHELFLEADLKNQESKNVKNPKSNALYRYGGYYLLELSNSSPDDSENIWINHKPISKSDLITLLNLKSDSCSIMESYNMEWWK